MEWSNFQNIFTAAWIHRAAKARQIYFLKLQRPSLQVQSASKKLVDGDGVRYVGVKCPVPGENIGGLKTGGFEFNLHKGIRCADKFRRAMQIR